MKNKKYQTPILLPKIKEIDDDGIHSIDRPEKAPEADNLRLDSEHYFGVLTNPYERMSYAHLADELIARLTESNTEDEPLKYDAVIYLDKSARPISWIVNELWRDFARVYDEGKSFDEQDIPDKPAQYFVNVDSQRKYSKEDIASLRMLFAEKPSDNLDDASGMPTVLDGKRILIVDELSITHATSSRAEAFVKLAFPTAEVSSYVWLDQGPSTNYGGYGGPTKFNIETWLYEDGGTGASTGKRTDDVRWYRRRRDTDSPRTPEQIAKWRSQDDGRGIIEVDAATDDELKRLRDSPRFRHSLKWVSARPKRLTKRSQQLRRDIHNLAEELRSGALPYWPSPYRLDFEERLQKFNGDISPRDFRDFREWFKNTWWVNFDLAPEQIKESEPNDRQRRAAAGLSTAAFSLLVKHGLLSKI